MAEIGGVHLVTGGSGYFGSVLVRALRVRGEEARVFDVVDAPDRPPDVTFIRGDIRDARAVRQACAGVDVVYHNVALVPLAKDRRAIWSVNYAGADNLLKCCRELGVSKVVHLSSSAVFGVPDRLPVDDTTAPRPREEYGRAKYAAEGLCWRYAEHGLDVTIIGPRTIAGPGRLGIMQILFEWIYQGRNVPVLGSGDNLHQFIHADDLADAVIRAGQRPVPRVYNVGAERFGTIRQLLRELIEHSGSKSRIVALCPARDRLDEPDRRVATLAARPLARPHVRAGSVRRSHTSEARARLVSALQQPRDVRAGL